MTDKPLFIPLCSEPYEAFENGTKRDELRQYGPRWNEKTCPVGRRVVLSKGYGKKNRLSGTIRSFHRRQANTFGSTYKAAIMRHYGTLDIEIAAIGIALETSVFNSDTEAEPEAGKD
ncbi:MAG: hypothetical protein KAI73_03715 [Rhodospirillaceae bacterium]|nr:hypothetical protein [Rhodospirillaceae bacterium]